jgi:hypothetical protein
MREGKSTGTGGMRGGCPFWRWCGSHPCASGCFVERATSGASRSPWTAVRGGGVTVDHRPHALHSGVRRVLLVVRGHLVLRRGASLETGGDPALRNPHDLCGKISRRGMWVRGRLASYLRAVEVKDVARVVMDWGIGGGVRLTRSSSESESPRVATLLNAGRSSGSVREWLPTCLLASR